MSIIHKQIVSVFQDQLIVSTWFVNAYTNWITKSTHSKFWIGQFSSVYRTS